jgi:chemotaxis methyl-accepting protein methylase
MSRSSGVESWPVVAGDHVRHWGLRGRWPLLGEVFDLSVEYAARVYLALAKRIWWRLPEAWRKSDLARAYGARVHALVLRFQPREQNHSTFFFRNRAELELLKHTLASFKKGSRLNLAVLGCSKGAEVYSYAWTIRSERPDLNLVLSAVDISQEILDFAQEGVYATGRRTSDASSSADLVAALQDQEVAARTQRDQGNISIFERVTEDEMHAMFDVAGDQAKVKPWLKEGILWRRGDVGSRAFARLVGPQDIVVANRFLCHMKPAAAEACLQSLAGVVAPGGYLFVTGVDLDVRTKVARERGWQPVQDLLREVYEGDPSLLSGWPLEPWSPEPFQPARSDREIRYASAFKIGNCA